MVLHSLAFIIFVFKNPKLKWKVITITDHRNGKTIQTFTSDFPIEMFNFARFQSLNLKHVPESNIQIYEFR